MDALTFLRERVALFAGVSEERLEELAVASSLISYNKGQTILFKGGTIDGLHVLAMGKVTVFSKPPNKPLVEIAELGPGEVFGETSIIEMGTSWASVKALEDKTLVLVIPQPAFRVLLEGNPEFVARLLALSSSRR